MCSGRKSTGKQWTLKTITNVAGVIAKWSALKSVQGLSNIRPTELLLAEAPPLPGLTTLERVQAETAAEETYYLEFVGPSPVQGIPPLD